MQQVRAEAFASAIAIDPARLPDLIPVPRRRLAPNVGRIWVLHRTTLLRALAVGLIVAGLGSVYEMRDRLGLIANSLYALGEREAGGDKFDQAETAYRLALEVYTREKTPVEWSMVENNLGITLLTAGVQRNDAAHVNAAIEASFEDWTEQLASLVMADPDATPIQRGMATWVSVLRSLPKRRPMLQSYVDALAQAQREPALQAQLAAHYRRARTRVAELVAQSLHDGTPSDDPRCLAIAAYVIAVCDGLAVQWLLDPQGVPDGDQLLDGLATVWANSFPDATAPAGPVGAAGTRRTPAR